MASTVLRGKYGDGSSGYHPLVCHLLDVLACAEQLWEHVLPPATRAWLAADLGLSAAGARRWVAALAGCHDLGKATPAFQFGTLPDLDGRFRAALAAEGLTQRAPPIMLRHDVLTASSLRGLLVQRNALPAPAAAAFAFLLGGHHGVFPSALDVAGAGPMSLGDRAWANARADLADTVMEAAGVSSTEVGPVRPGPRAVMLLAGLVSVADWIGSNTDFFPYAMAPGAEPGPADIVGYVAQARFKARLALDALGWLAVPHDPQPVSFASMFAFEPRPVQALAERIASSLSPSAIVVVEAPMGEGKTEAALFLADRWSSMSGGRGIYLALPTQATSNQMFHRVRATLRRRYPSEVIALQLLHGHAALSAEFETLRQAGDRLFSPTDVDPDGEPRDGDVVAGTWFTARKRGLLAPFGVGTIDQVLLAALVTRHVFVRLFGLAGKVVVLDEVHAYDAYMSTLLERLVEWLAALGTSVVVLSATLPDAKRRALLAAYAQGAGWGPPAGDSAVYPRVSWLSAAGVGTETVDCSPAARRTLDLRWVEAGDDGSIDDVDLDAIAAAGGCVAFVCNTVERAQDLYRRLRDRLPGAASDGEPTVDLLHARFPFDERAVREGRVLRRFGPRAGADRPDRAFVVATQVIEQSLDLDFDGLVTDFAPIDLLLQRSGRLHRHPANDDRRPAALARPVLRVVRPAPGTRGEPIVDPGTAAVYDDRHVLLRTWLALRGRESIAVPEEVGPLVEAVYDERASPDNLAPEEQAAWRRTVEAHRDALAADAAEARDRWVRSPGDAEASVTEMTRNAADDDPDAGTFRALTRLDADSELVVCLEQGADGSPAFEGSPIDLDAPASLHDARRLLGRSLRVSSRRLLPLLRAVSVPKGWRRSALLRSARPLCFAADGTLDLADASGRSVIRLVLDPEIGLAIDRSMFRKTT